MSKYHYLQTATVPYYQPHGNGKVEVDLRKFFEPVYNQGDKGSCSASRSSCLGT